MEKKKQSKWPLYLSIFIIGSILLLYFTYPPVKQFFSEAWKVLSSGEEKRISEWVGQFSWWGPLIIVFAMMAQMFLLVIPSPVLMVVTVLAYGPFLGSGINVVAIFCASSLGYGLGAYFGTPLIQKILGEKSRQKIEGFIEDYGFWAIIVTRLSPILSDDAISLIAGILRMGYWRFMGATMLGIFPLAVLIAYLGENNERLQSGLIWVGIISLIGFLIYVWWDRKKR